MDVTLVALDHWGSLGWTVGVLEVAHLRGEIFPTESGDAQQHIDRRSQWLRDRGRVAEGLRGHLVQAVAAVEVAAKHPEAVRETTWIGIKERLLLDRVTLNAADVAPGNLKPATAVEPDLADACPSACRAIGARLRHSH